VIPFRDYWIAEIIVAILISLIGLSLLICCAVEHFNDKSNAVIILVKPREKKDEHIPVFPDVGETIDFEARSAGGLTQMTRKRPGSVISAEDYAHVT
jgi:hypothetical protein